MPTSANTEYTLCVPNCSGNLETINFPHSVYSDAQNNDVVQMNTVQLGGQNGVYN